MVEQKVELESMMRPGSSSQEGFLDRTESLCQVIAVDDETIKRLGLEHDQFADRLETITQKARRMLYLASKADKKLDYWKVIKKGLLVEDNFSVSWVSYMGYQGCPYDCDALSDTDYTVTNVKTGKSVFFSKLHIHLIRKHHFFEGHTKYRLDPATCAEILDIRSGQDCTPKYQSKKFWIPSGGWISGQNETIADYEDEVRSRKQFHTAAASIMDNGHTVNVGRQRKAWATDENLFIISLQEDDDKQVANGIPIWETCHGAYTYKLEMVRWVNP